MTLNGKLSSKKVLVLSCFFYCIYTSDLPQIRQFESTIFIYTDDITIAYQSEPFAEIEEVLKRISTYFKNWRLKANPGKSVHCVYNLTDQATLKLS